MLNEMFYKKLGITLIVSLLFLSVCTNYNIIKTLRNDNIKIDTFSPITFKGKMRITTFASPDSSFEAVIDALNSTNTSLFIEMYSFSNPYILDVLGNLSAKGVNINIILHRYHASYYENEYTYWTAYELYDRGINVYWANSTEFRYTHAKFAIIDNTTVLIESENWAKSGVPKNPTYGNRGWGVVIENTELADYFLDVFFNDLAIAEPYDPSTADHGTPVSYIVQSGHYTPIAEVETINEYAEVTPILSPDFSESLIIQLINSANESLYIEQMYIYSELEDIINAITSAKNRGVDVKIILDPRSSENNETAQILIQHNISVAYANTSYYGSPHLFETMHNKGMIIDEKIVLVSSINWSPTSLRDNREAGVIIKNTKVAQYFTRLFEADWETAAEYLYGAPEPEETPQPSWIEQYGWVVLLVVLIVLFVVIKYAKK